MNADEREALAFVAHWVDRPTLTVITERVRIGRTAYGPLDIDNDKRDFLGEALEELADCLVYLAIACIWRIRKGKSHGEVELLARFVGLIFSQLQTLRSWGR